MGQSKQTSRIDTGPWGPTQGPLTSNALPRIEEQYQSDISDPNRLAPQARGYVGDVLGGKYLDPSTNPHLGALSSSIWGQVAPQISSVFSRAGRGTSANASGLGGALTQGFTSALAQPLFNQYNIERGLQQDAAGMAAPLDAASSLPLEQYLERLRGLAALGQKGTSTTTATASPLQTMAGIGLTAAGMFGSRGLFSKGGIFG